MQVPDKCYIGSTFFLTSIQNYTKREPCWRRVEHYYVEQDMVAAPKEALGKSAAYLRGKFSFYNFITPGHPTHHRVASCLYYFIFLFSG